jgi:serpin B
MSTGLLQGGAVGRILWTCVFALLLTACGSDTQERGGRGAKGSDPGVQLVKAEAGRVQKPDVTDEQVGDLVGGNNDFAFEMYGAAGEAGNGEGNVIFSPYSVSLAFSLAYAGARGETETEMAETLNFLPQETQHPAFNAIESRMSGLGEKDRDDPSPPFRLNVANSAWGQEGFRFEQAYLETLAEQYGAGMRPANFGQPEKASEEINAWVEDETEDRIKDLLPPDFISPDTRLVLANAVYFKAAWASSFVEKRTQDGMFALPDGGEVTVPLMRQTSYLPYAEGDGYQAVRLPYKGDAAEMLVVLPEEGRFEEIEGRLDADFLDEVGAKINPDAYVRLTMPRFDYETRLDLLPLLRSMGMTTPFDGGEADFSGITREAPLFIGDAVHNANVTVDEKGTEAAAATALGFPVSGPPPLKEMTANRPFLFAITERETGTILFLGRVTDPS